MSLPDSTSPGPLPPIQERLCAGIAAGEGQDPIGTATYVDRVMVVEIATPWTRAGVDADPGGSIPQRVMAVQRRRRLLADAGNSETRGRIYGVAPDAEWSRPGVRRVLVAGHAASSPSYDLVEYGFPSDSSRVVDFAEAFLTAPDTLGGFASDRVDRPDMVELLVCTHGRRDACCAKFGMPLFKQARARSSRVRAWRAMHFGGHRFAPTAWEFPSGYMWGFLTEEAATSVLDRSDVTGLGRHVRGWSGVPRPVQPLDRLGLLEHGWNWLSFSRRGEILEYHDGRVRWWRVKLEYTTTSGETGVLLGTTRVGRQLPSVGCGAEWGQREGLVDELELVDGLTAREGGGRL